MTTKQIMLPALAVVVGGAVIFASVGYVQAQGTYLPIVERLAEKFNLNKDEVQGVFDQVHDEHHTQMRQNLEQKLSDAVQKGTITEDQKTAILAKMDQKFELKIDFKDLSDEERQQQMEQHRQEFETWLKDNGLTSEILKQIGVGPFGKGFRHHLKDGTFIEKVD